MNNPYFNPYQFAQMQSPFQQAPQFQQQQAQQLIRVSGLEGAKAYQMPPNSSVALFHESEDIFYIKTSDGAGFPTIRTFRFVPVNENETVEKAEQYVTLDEFNRFKEEINGKLPLRKSTAKNSSTASEE